MSELDFEEEITEDPSASLHGESIIDEDKMNGGEKLSSAEDTNKDIVQMTSRTTAETEVSDGEIIESESDSGKLSDLEEGEINDPTPPVKSNNMCRFFLRGTCQFGTQCRFVHIRDSSYRLFNAFDNMYTMPTKRMVHFKNAPKPSFFYPPKSELPDSHSTFHEDDNWDKALQEAKALMLSARDRKETNVEFEKKKMYLSCEEDDIKKDASCNPNEKSHYMENRDKYKHNSALKSNGHNYVGKETSLKRGEFHSKNNVRPQDWVDPWRRSRSRTRRSSSHSSFSSRSSSHHSCRSSCSSTRSSSRSPKKSSRKKLKSNLNRKYSRHRSRKRSRSWSLPHSSRSRSYSREKSSSFTSSRSRSRSSSAGSFSKIYSNEYLPPKSENLNSSAKEKSPLHQSKKRKLNSPSSLTAEIKLKDPPTNLRWEMDSSDITVSCISCTSLSCSDVSSASDDGSVNKSERIASCTGHRDKKSSSDLKETQNDNFKTDSLKYDKNVHSSTKSRSRDKYPGYKHHQKHSNAVECTTGEVTKHRKSTELDTLSSNKVHAHSPKLKPSDSQDCSVRKNINLNLKSKSNISDKSLNSCTVSEELPIKLKPPLSRREQLLMQLEAVELAIAKKKQL